MYRKVESWVDLISLEKEMLAFWDETGALKKLRQQNQGKKHWSFLDGPITANNPMGVHHAWGRTLKDAYQRYWAMNGRELRYQNGYDCQGLWVEVEVEKELGFATKRQIEDFGIGTFVDKCKERVLKYAAVQTEQSIRLGYWMDWDRADALRTLSEGMKHGRDVTITTPAGDEVSGPAHQLVAQLGRPEWGGSYFTFSTENNETIWTFLKKCHERGKIYRGTDVMPWSGRSGTGYSQMEVVEGRKLVAHEALFLKFPLRGRSKENLLVWTTTPWTLTSNVGAMVNVDLEYVKLRCKGDGELYYFAAENLKYQRLKRQHEEGKEWIDGVPKLKTIAEMFDARGGYEVEGYIRGAEMVGWEYDGPFDELEAQSVVGGFPFTEETVPLSGVTAHRVIDGGRDSKGNPVVVVGEGTGIVHTAPGCGDIDHELGKKLGLPHIAPLDDEAKFLDKFGWLTGKHALEHETVKWIRKSLDDKGLLVHTEMYPHVYPHCWRSGDPLVFRLVDEWYINMDWRDEIKEIVKQIQWIPAWGEEREIEWLTNMRDWMISKKRFWGLALPIWVCEDGDCGWYDVVGSLAELEERAIEGWDEFVGHSPHRPWVDKVKLRCEKCGKTAHRVPDVGNPWLDAGIVTYSTVHYNTNREYWEKWVPTDLVLECFPGQFRNWFYSLLAMSTMMENTRPFKTLVGHALVRDENGQEMHKSSGNAIPFEGAAEEGYWFAQRNLSPNETTQQVLEKEKLPDGALELEIRAVSSGKDEHRVLMAKYPPMGADIMRWIYCRQEPTSNLNFGFGPGKEVRGKFYNTLWNTYSFFVNYARLDEFVPSTEPTPVSKRPPFDRWISSKLQVLIETCRSSFEAFNTRTASMAIETFVEDLSNWYIRQNRRRFWKTDDPADQRMAYETLYECLFALVRLVAPIIPFTAEAIYQNLVRSIDEDAPESVHHTEFPRADTTIIDVELNEDMAAIQRISSLALKAREMSKFKVRQPLAALDVGPADSIEQRAAARFESLLKEELNVKEIRVADPERLAPEAPVTYVAKPNLKRLGKRLKQKLKPFKELFRAQAAEIGEEFNAGGNSFTLTVDGEPIILKEDDVFVNEVPSKEAAMALDNDSWVCFDTEITEDLRVEGLMRELLRGLQVYRKEIGLEIEDRIHITFETDSETVRTIVSRFEESLKSELLARSLEAGEIAEGGKTFKLDSEVVTISIAKA